MTEVNLRGAPAKRVFRVPATWLRTSRIDESLRHAMSERRWNPSTNKLVPCEPHLASSSHGYPVYYLAEGDHGDMLVCADCASNADSFGYEYRITKADANWEDPQLWCDACSERIESAYAEDEQEARNILAKVENGAELTPEELSTARLYATKESINSINEETIRGLRKAGFRPLGPDEQEEDETA